VDVPGLWVPASALTRGVRGLWAVYAVEGALEADPGLTDAEGPDAQVAVRHPVEVLHGEAERVLVRGTLDGGSPVIVGNTEKITPGQRVVPIEEASAPTAVEDVPPATAAE
jgi:hypothetical protein